MAGTLPWKVGTEVRLNISSVIRELSLAASDPVVRATIRWSGQEGKNCLTGVKFIDVDDELQNQLMAWCLGKPLPEGY